MAEIRALRTDDKREGFRSGDVELDRFFGDLPKSIKKRLSNYPLPALRLARLVVAEAAQGLGVGKQLLKAVFQIAHEMVDRTGCVAVVVDAKPTTIEFYQQYGFEHFETIAGSLAERPSPTQMILSIRSIPRST